MPGPGDAQHGPGGVDAAAYVRHRHEAQDRAELLVRQRLLGDDKIERRQQDPGVAADADAGLAGDECGILADESQVERAVREDELAHPVPLVVREQVGALPVQVAEEVVDGGLLADQDRLVRAQHRVVEALRVHDALGRQRQVGRLVDENRDVARPDPDGRSARAVGAPTTAVPPVATMTSVRSSVMSALMSGTDGSSTTWIDPFGCAGFDGGLRHAYAPRPRRPPWPSDAGSR